MDGDTLFKTSKDALVFALNFSGEQYDKPAMNRLASPSAGTGKGLFGTDGATQAGFVLAELKAMGKIPEAILISRLAPRLTPCNCRAACCAGHRLNKVWANAISILADHVRTTALSGCVVNGLMRREYVVRCFTKKDDRASIESLAERYEIDRHTVSAHAGKVMAYFSGVTARKDKPAVPGMEQIAMDAIEDRLRGIGMVG